MQLLASRWVKNFSLTLFFASVLAYIYSLYISDSYFNLDHEVTRNNSSLQQTMLLGVLGDILLHKEHQLIAFQAGSFLPLWAPVQHILQLPDLLYGNFEGTSTSEVSRPSVLLDWVPPVEGCEVVPSDLKMEYGRVYHSWDFLYIGAPPEHDNLNWFNYHPQLAKDLRDSGVHIVSTANNHAWDTCNVGVDKTIETLNEANIKNFGTKRKGINDEWFEITKTNVGSGSSQITFTLAWVACAGHINGDKSFSQKDKYQDQLLLCGSDDFKDTILYLDTQRSDVDGVIGVVHEGVMNTVEPQGDVVDYVNSAVSSGAFLVLANHPHRAQKIERVQGRESRQSFVVWAVGDFMNHRFVSGILLLQLQKQVVGGRVRARVECFQYTPMCNVNQNQEDHRRHKLQYKQWWEIKHSPILHLTQGVLSRCDAGGKGDERCQECRDAEESLEDVWGKEFKMNPEQGFQCKEFE